MLILLVIALIVIMYNLIPALMYDNGHYISDIVVSFMLSIVYMPIAILLHPN